MFEDYFLDNVLFDIHIVGIISVSKLNIYNQVEQIKKFELLPYEWSVEGGELTPTLKLKRKVIMEKYKDAIERIYN